MSADIARQKSDMQDVFRHEGKRHVGMHDQKPRKTDFVRKEPARKEVG